MFEIRVPARLCWAPRLKTIGSKSTYANVLINWPASLDNWPGIR